MFRIDSFLEETNCGCRLTEPEHNVMQHWYKNIQLRHEDILGKPKDGFIFLVFTLNHLSSCCLWWIRTSNSKWFSWKVRKKVFDIRPVILKATLKYHIWIVNITNTFCNFYVNPFTWNMRGSPEYLGIVLLAQFQTSCLHPCPRCNALGRGRHSQRRGTQEGRKCESETRWRVNDIKMKQEVVEAVELEGKKMTQLTVLDMTHGALSGAMW